jgi:hypothetical protein
MLKEYKQVKVSSLNSGNIVDLFELFKLKSLLNKVGIKKEKGHSILEMLIIFMIVTLEGRKSLFCGIKYNNLTKLKTPINDMLNNPNYKWRNLLYNISAMFIKLSGETKDCCLIFDDTVKKKIGRMGEYLSWFFDHSTGTYFRGYQNITAVWCNTRSAIVTDFELKIGKKKTKRSPRPKYYKYTHTEQRNRFAKETKTEIVIKMIKRAMQRKLPFKYILWDSWFNNNTSYKFIFESLIPLGKTLISMLKNGNLKYRYGNRDFNLKELYKRSGKWSLNKNTGIKTKSIIVYLLDTTSSKKINERIEIGQIKICFYKYPNVKRWKAILSTDLQLSEEEVLKIYLRRWSIECIFKEVKQYFGYDQSKSSKYCAMVADLTIRYMFYNMLCYKKQQDGHDSMEQLLIEFCEQLEEAFLTNFINIIIGQQVKKVLDYAIANGYNNLIDFRKDIDIILRKFFEKEIIIDKITEADNQYFRKAS